MSLSKYIYQNLIKYKNNRFINKKTFQEIYELSKYYQDKFNFIQPNDRVCISAPKSEDWVAIMIATLSKGGIFIPIPNLEEKFINNSKPNLIISGKDLYMTRNNYIKKNINNNQDIATILFTSGSSGNPKGVILTHQNILHNLNMINNLYKYEITSKDVSFSLLPWHHCYGLVCELLFLLGKGSNIITPNNQNNPLKMFKEIKWNNPSILFTVPKMLDRVVKYDIPFIPNNIKKRLIWGNKLRMMSVGGSFCHEETIKLIEKTYNVKVYQGYGMTETSPMISLNNNLNNKIGSVGKPLENVEIKICKNTNEIQVKSPSLMMGYLENINEKTNEIFTFKQNNDWFQTGDKGYLDENNYLFINGRIKNEYKLSNGKYINPQFIEDLILKSKSIDQVVIFPSINNEFNECLIYSSKIKDKNLIANEIQSLLKNKIKNYEIPKNIIFVLEPFTIENGLLSLKFEPKRNLIIENYQKNKILVY